MKLKSYIYYSNQTNKSHFRKLKNFSQLKSSFLIGFKCLVKAMRIYPRVIYKAVALYEITHLWDFNHAFLHEDRPGITSVRDKA